MLWIVKRHLLRLCGWVFWVWREMLLAQQPTGPNPLHRLDHFSGPVLRHGSLDSLLHVDARVPHVADGEETPASGLGVGSSIYLVYMLS